jgi:hypothetical protein
MTSILAARLSAPALQPSGDLGMRYAFAALKLLQTLLDMGDLPRPDFRSASSDSMVTSQMTQAL